MGQSINPMLYRRELNQTWMSSYKEHNHNEISYQIYQDLQIRKFVEKFFSECSCIIHTLKLRRSRNSIELLILYYKPSASPVTSKFFVPQTSVSDKNLYSTPDFSQYLTESLLQYFSAKLSFKVFLRCINNTPMSLLKKPLQAHSYFDILNALRRHYREPSFNDFINTLFVTLSRNNSAKLLSRMIAVKLSESKRHSLLFNFWRKAILFFVNSSFSNLKGLKISIKGRINGRPRAKTINIIAGNVPCLTLSAKIDYAKSTSYTQNGTFGVKVWICSIKI